MLAPIRDVSSIDISEIEAAGPLIEVSINAIGSKLAGISATGLIDTGATSILISQKIADNLDLTLIDEDDVDVIGGGKVHAKIYSALVSVAKLKFGERMRVLAVGMMHSTRDVLLGRSFLKRFIMNYDGPKGMFHMEHIVDHMIEELDG